MATVYLWVPRGTDLNRGSIEGEQEEIVEVLV